MRSHALKDQPSLSLPPLKFRTAALDFDRRTLLMGVVNVTPDSFSDGGNFFSPKRAVDRALELAREGADLIDIGGESSRPGAEPVFIEEELRRVIPVIEALKDILPVPISIDTYKAEVARQALDAGAQMVNDISGLRLDSEMASVVASYRVPVILMHMRETPKTMQNHTDYDDLLGEIQEFFQKTMERAGASGIDPSQIIIDPGIGFGKTADQNLSILRNLQFFHFLGRPILVGTSRKSFIGAVLDSDVNDRREGTAATLVAAILNGAQILRVHEIKEIRKAVKMADAIKFGMERKEEERGA